MPDLKDGETAEVQGSAKAPYVLKNVGGVYSCSCIAWRNQSLPIDKRTCKHLKKFRGDVAEATRLGTVSEPQQQTSTPKPDKSVPPVLLAHTWDSEIDITGWWMSEKLDGIRAYWNGSQFLSRQGNVFHAPQWFVSQLPNFALDGELWMARKSFDLTSSIVRRQNGEDLWKKLAFLVFDAPEIEGKFEARQDFYQRHFQNNHSDNARPLEMQRCRGIDHLKEELKRVESLGGEGLMMRQPESLYEAGRSHTLLKIKSFIDAEATIIGYKPGKGKHKGKVGALLVVMEQNQIEFAIGTGLSDKERSAPPAIGTKITFSYQELSPQGVPRFPAYMRVFNGH